MLWCRTTYELPHPHDWCWIFPMWIIKFHSRTQTLITAGYVNNVTTLTNDNYDMYDYWTAKIKRWPMVRVCDYRLVVSNAARPSTSNGNHRQLPIRWQSAGGDQPCGGGQPAVVSDWRRLWLSRRHLWSVQTPPPVAVVTQTPKAPPANTMVVR